MSSKRKNRPTKLSKNECGEYENGSGINNTDSYLNHSKYIGDEEDEENDDISTDNADDSDVDVEDNKFGHTIKRDIKLDMSSSDSDPEFDDNESGHSTNYGIDNSGHIFGNNLMNSNKLSKRSMDDVLKKLTSKMLPKCEDDKKIRFD